MIQRSGVTTLTPPVSKQDHVLGPESAPVTLVEYGDYECPYCGMAHLTVKEVLQLLGDQLRFVFRHFPLIQIHPHAERAAETAEAAGSQGKFWAMHDTLFEHQRALDNTHLALYATSLDLDKDRFVRELTEHNVILQHIVAKLSAICITKRVARYTSQMGFELRWEVSPHLDWLVKSVHAKVSRSSPMF